jgi:predicted DNA-binding ribbon-helix-helix protein
LPSFDDTVTQQPREPRVVQFAKRRYSIRLEAVFWRYLERCAGERQMRLGRLIGELAEDSSPDNLTSFLRVFCMLDAERRTAARALGRGSGVFDALAECPLPAVLLSRERTIIALNQALNARLDPARPAHIGEDLAKIFQIRTSEPFVGVWRALINGRIRRARARLVYVAPGRVDTLEATFVALERSRLKESQAYVLAWLVPSAGAARVSAPAPAQTLQASMVTVSGKSGE